MGLSIVCMFDYEKKTWKWELGTHPTITEQIIFLGPNHKTINDAYNSILCFGFFASFHILCGRGHWSSCSIVSSFHFVEIHICQLHWTDTQRYYRGNAINKLFQVKLFHHTNFFIGLIRVFCCRIHDRAMKATDVHRMDCTRFMRAGSVNKFNQFYRFAMWQIQHIKLSFFSHCI